jgi:beta-glucosidase
VLLCGVAGSGSGGNGLSGAYYNNRWLSGTPVLTRIDKFIDLDWGTTQLITPSAQSYVSVLWTGFVQPPVSGSVTFTVQVDDGARLFVDSVLVIDAWTAGAGMRSQCFPTSVVVSCLTVAA